MIRYPLLLISLSFTPFALAGLRDYVSVAVGENAILELPQVANYRRIPSEGPQVGQEHIYRVCNGKNKKTCGFWENVKTKKKVASGVTNYNKNKKSLIVKKVQPRDFGTYMTGNKNWKIDILKKFNAGGGEEEEEEVVFFGK